MADSSYASVVETRQESSSNSPPTIDKIQGGNSWNDDHNSTLQRRGQHWQMDPALTANTQQGRNIWSSSTTATSSCYLPRGVNGMSSYGSSVSSVNNQHLLGSIGDSRLGPHQQIGSNFHRQHDDFSSDSMMNSRTYNNHKNNFHNHHDHLAASLGQLNLYEGGDDVSNAGTSLNSMTSTSIPGVVGVSSGSTGGNSSIGGNSNLWMNARQQQRFGQHRQRQYQQTEDSDYAVGKFPPHAHQTNYPKYPHQQQNSYRQAYASSHSMPPDQTSFPSGAPPGFVSMSSNASGLPYQHSSNFSGDGGDDETPLSYDETRSTNRVRRRKRGGVSKGRHRGAGAGCGQRRNGKGKVPAERNWGDESDSVASFIPLGADDATAGTSKASSEAIRMLMKPPSSSTTGDGSISSTSALTASRLNLDGAASLPSTSLSFKSVVSTGVGFPNNASSGRPILPTMEDYYQDPLLVEDDYDDEGADDDDDDDFDFDEDSDGVLNEPGGLDNQLSPVTDSAGSARSKKRDWLLRMNRRLSDVPVGELDPTTIPISAIMNAWSKTKSKW